MNLLIDKWQASLYYGAGLFMINSAENELGLGAREGMWEQFGLSDRGKLLAIFYGSDAFDGPDSIDRKSLDSYVFLLQEDGVVPSYYNFRFNPFPSSESLHEDTDGLVMAGFLDPSLSMTDKGQKWAQDNLINISEEDAETLLRPVAEELTQFEPLDREELFKLVYTKLTRQATP